MLNNYFQQLLKRGGSCKKSSFLTSTNKVTLKGKYLSLFTIFNEISDITQVVTIKPKNTTIN